MTDFRFQQLIDGQWVDASNGGVWELINPATEQALGTLPYGNADDANAAIAVAARAFPDWSQRTAYDRSAILARVQGWIDERLDSLARITTEESGKPLAQAQTEWQVVGNLFQWYSEECKRAYGRMIPARKPGRRILVTHQPIGVVGTITAWNFPISNAARAWSAALAAGCTVVGRPSEYTPRSLMALAQGLSECGIPAGVINLVNGEADPIGKAMLSHKSLRKLHFTGSTRVGKLLMDGASQTVTRLSLELGGNAPAIIFPDVDVAKVVEEALTVKFRNGGQVCIAPQRFFVHSQIIEEFLDHAVRLVESYQVGNGLEASTDIGPMINHKQRQHIENLITQARQEGVQILTGGQRPSHLAQGYFYQPTVVSGLQPDSALWTQEIFGPVVPVMAFDDTEAVLAQANATDYGLAAYVCTHDMNTAIRLYEGLEFGMVGVNDWLPSTPEAPFGGFKESGIDRECGAEGLESYLETKAVYIGL